MRALAAALAKAAERTKWEAGSAPTQTQACLREDFNAIAKNGYPNNVAAMVQALWQGKPRPFLRRRFVQPCKRRTLMRNTAPWNPCIR